ncbi:hypothetical protein P9869_01930 [Streptomyces ossamyceticus]|nr:hypothetical protein [Streptomyces ossamyceticus]
MKTLLVAAVAPPTILLTTALVVAIGFWLLVAVGVTTADSFDEDVDLGPWGLGGVPVAAALSLLTAAAWSLSVGATSALAASLPSGPAAWLLRVTAPAGGLLAAWWLVRLLVRVVRRRRSLRECWNAPTCSASRRPARRNGRASPARCTICSGTGSA